MKPQLLEGLCAFLLTLRLLGFWLIILFVLLVGPIIRRVIFLLLRLRHCGNPRIASNKFKLPATLVRISKKRWVEMPDAPA